MKIVTSKPNEIKIGVPQRDFSHPFSLISLSMLLPPLPGFGLITSDDEERLNFHLSELSVLLNQTNFYLATEKSPVTLFTTWTKENKVVLDVHISGYFYPQ